MLTLYRREARECSRLKMARETWQFNAMNHLCLNPGFTEKKKLEAIKYILGKIREMCIWLVHNIMLYIHIIFLGCDKLLWLLRIVILFL